MINKAYIEPNILLMTCLTYFGTYVTKNDQNPKNSHISYQKSQKILKIPQKNVDNLHISQRLGIKEKKKWLSDGAHWSRSVTVNGR